MAARAENRKNFKHHLLVTTGRISIKLDRIVPWEVFYQIAQTIPLHYTKWLPGLKIENTSNDISTVTTGQIAIEHDRIVPWEVLYQNCSNRSALLHKMAARAKTRKKTNKQKTSNDIFSITPGRISTKLDRIVPWEVLYQNCSKCYVQLNKMATRAKNRMNFK